MKDLGLSIQCMHPKREGAGGISAEGTGGTASSGAAPPVVQRIRGKWAEGRGKWPYRLRSDLGGLAGKIRRRRRRLERLPPEQQIEIGCEQGGQHHGDRHLVKDPDQKLRSPGHGLLRGIETVDPQGVAARHGLTELLPGQQNAQPHHHDGGGVKDLLPGQPPDELPPGGPEEEEAEGVQERGHWPHGELIRPGGRVRPLGDLHAGPDQDDEKSQYPAEDAGERQHQRHPQNGLFQKFHEVLPLSQIL